MDIQIKPCSLNNYEELLSMLAKSFSFSDSAWFENNLGHVCPPLNLATEEIVSRNFVALHNDKIVGSLGAYPVDWILSQQDTVNFKIAGVGQVACLEEYRGNAIMSRLLKHAIEYMESTCELSWLQGDRFRYKNYGWDFAGNNLVFSFTQKKLNSLSLPSGEIHAASQNDIPLLNSLYEKLPSYIVRDEPKWKLQLLRKNYHWKICHINNKSGYIAYNQNSFGIINEACGDEECLALLLSRYMSDNLLNNVKLYYPMATDSLAFYFYSIASSVELKSIGQIKILNSTRVFDKISPFVNKQMDLERLGTLDSETKMQIISKMLGFSYIPIAEHRFARLEPLTFWLPLAEDV